MISAVALLSSPTRRRFLDLSTAERAPTRLEWESELEWRIHCGQHIAQRKRGEGGAAIGRCVGNDELSAVDQAAAGVNDVGHVAFPLVFVGLDQGFA